MPGWAGSSWYYLRYMDPHNADRFVGEDVEKYWGQVDLYMGGAEHATGHLLYSRFWYLFLKDLGLVTANEPFQKLINQGMILGVSAFALRLDGRSNGFIVDGGKHVFFGEDVLPKGDLLTGLYSVNSLGGKQYQNNLWDFSKRHVPVDWLESDNLTPSGQIELTSWIKEDCVFICSTGYWRDGKFYDFDHKPTDKTEPFVTLREVEKMSKSKYNVVNPDVLIDKYGADALRLYEMFLGPLEQFKPWNTNGISGVATFLKKFWRLFHPEDGPLAVTDEAASPAELKTLHRVIQKVAQDIDKFSFNTSVSTFMIAVNELTALGTHKRAVLEPLVILLSPFAPHLAEELWAELGHAPGSISHAAYPEFREEYLVEANVTYPVAINGKVREQRQFAATATAAEIEAAILESDFLTRFAEGKAPKKVVVVPGRMVNVVV
jgi:leucyl-tRNA synthetase